MQKGKERKGGRDQRLSCKKESVERFRKAGIFVKRWGWVWRGGGREWTGGREAGERAIERLSNSSGQQTMEGRITRGVKEFHSSGFKV